MIFSLRGSSVTHEHEVMTKTQEAASAWGSCGFLVFWLFIPVTFSDTFISCHVVASVKMNQHLSSSFLRNETINSWKRFFNNLDRLFGRCSTNSFNKNSANKMLSGLFPSPSSNETTTHIKAADIYFKTTPGLHFQSVVSSSESRQTALLVYWWVRSIKQSASI